MHKTYESANLFEKAVGKAHQLAAASFHKSAPAVPAGFRTVSICFDDFPDSAGKTGARIMEDSDMRGSFFTCFGLLGKDSFGGRLASPERIRTLQQNGHDIGCHTYDHLNCSFATPHKAIHSCNENRKAAAAHAVDMRHFAYPQGGMRLGAKHFLKTRYQTARGGFPGINRGRIDAHCLKSVPFYEKATTSVHMLLNRLEARGGWLILFTHDVCELPSEHGITGKTLNHLLARCRSHNLPVLTMSQAFDRIREHACATT